MINGYQDLEVWQRSINLAGMTYRLSARFPREERFDLTRQIRRSATSVPANIAEGAARHGTKEFLQFLGIASGSLAETETHLVLAQRLGWHMKTNSSPCYPRRTRSGKCSAGSNAHYGG